MNARTADRLAYVIGGAVTAFLAAACLWLLLGRLGDAAGSRVAGWSAIAAAGVTLALVAAAAVFVLRNATPRDDPAA